MVLPGVSLTEPPGMRAVEAGPVGPTPATYGDFNGPDYP
jgi:hypothetical protein